MTLMIGAESNGGLNILLAASDSQEAHFRKSVTSALQRKFQKINLAVLHGHDEQPLLYQIGSNGIAVSKSIDEHIARCCAWADMLVIAPMDADSLARMLHGLTGSCLLLTLRSWDVAKKILLIPGMSASMWENPMTKKQLSKIRRKWNWIRVLPPRLWAWPLNKEQRKYLPWEGMEELTEAVGTHIDLMTIEHDVEVSHSPAIPLETPTRADGPVLPPEIWSMILDFTNDWELATALNIHTSVPVPPEWAQAASNDGPRNTMERLEWTMLTGRRSDIRKLLTDDPPRWLSRPCIKLIMRFAMVDLLAFIEAKHSKLFWSTFGHTFLPDAGSAKFGRVEILEFWRTSPSFLSRKYTKDAINEASGAGFVHVLDWWHQSGLPLLYTEVALEQASSKGRLNVLDWWKSASSPSLSANDHNPRTPLALKIGKSLITATQSGSLPTLHWWATSSLPLPHAASIPRVASAHGHVHILEYWRTHTFASSKISTPPTPPLSLEDSMSGRDPDSPDLLGTQSKTTDTVDLYLPSSPTSTSASPPSTTTSPTAGSTSTLSMTTCTTADKTLAAAAASASDDTQILVGATKMGHVAVLEWWRRSGLRVLYKTCDIEEALEDGIGGPAGDRVRRWWARNGLNLGVGTSEWMKTKVL